MQIVPDRRASVGRAPCPAAKVDLERYRKALQCNALPCTPFTLPTALNKKGSSKDDLSGLTPLEFVQYPARLPLRKLLGGKCLNLRKSSETPQIPVFRICLRSLFDASQKARLTFDSHAISVARFATGKAAACRCCKQQPTQPLGAIPLKSLPAKPFSSIRGKTAGSFKKLPFLLFFHFPERNAGNDAYTTQVFRLRRNYA